MPSKEGCLKLQKKATPNPMLHIRDMFKIKRLAKTYFTKQKYTEKQPHAPHYGDQHPKGRQEVVPVGLPPIHTDAHAPPETSKGRRFFPSGCGLWKKSLKGLSRPKPNSKRPSPSSNSSRTRTWTWQGRPGSPGVGFTVGFKTSTVGAVGSQTPTWRQDRDRKEPART